MSFDTSAYLRRATPRAKSDVANKLISMFLHEISRRLVSQIGLSVTDAAYTDAVFNLFGVHCAYCNRPLELDRAAVEHPDGMNRFRAGLHIPGNVIVACKRCNNEKRRDDSLANLVLAQTGWESFLGHDSSRCPAECKTCAYWNTIWPDAQERATNLRLSRERIERFREKYVAAMRWIAEARPHLVEKLGTLYRECQSFATDRIRVAADSLFEQLSFTPHREPPAPLSAIL